MGLRLRCEIGRIVLLLDALIPRPYPYSLDDGNHKMCRRCPISRCLVQDSATICPRADVRHRLDIIFPGLFLVVCSHEHTLLSREVLLFGCLHLDALEKYLLTPTEAYILEDSCDDRYGN